MYLVITTLMTYNGEATGDPPPSPNGPDQCHDPRNWWFSRAESVTLCENVAEVEAAFRSLREATRSSVTSCGTCPGPCGDFDVDIDIFEIVGGKAVYRGYGVQSGRVTIDTGADTLPRERRTAWSRVLED